MMVVASTAPAVEEGGRYGKTQEVMLNLETGGEKGGMRGIRGEF